MSKNSNRFFSLLILMFLGVLAGCSPNTKTYQETKVVSDRQGGTDTTGGGNGVNGKPYESYIEKQIESRPYYANIITPLIAKLAEASPGLAADFYHITLERVWYFVPVELEKISSSVLGSYGKHDQYALQDLRKIWFDSNHFDKMSEQDQATLVIHEIIMGIRLMEFTHKQDQCIAKAARTIITDSSRKTFGDQKRKCRRTYPDVGIGSDNRFKLDNRDYDLIRRIVSVLDRQNPDVEEAISLMESFRKYD